MCNNSRIFNTNEGIGGFEQGLYDNKFIKPTDLNWTRQSCYNLPNIPKLKWKVYKNDTFLGMSLFGGGSFAISNEKTIIVSECNQNLYSDDTKLIEIYENGIINVLFSCNKRLGTPVIGKDGFIFIATHGALNSKGHKLFCLFPDGTIKWEYNINNNIHDNLILDKDGNIYMFTYGDLIGTLLSISIDGTLNWEYKFDSINWCDPVISKEGIIYIGLNVTKTLCALNKNGEMLWEKVIGQGLGTNFMNIKYDGTIYVCFDLALHALSPDGNIKWTYNSEAPVHATPALDKDGKLYLNKPPCLLVSLNEEGHELWSTDIENTILQAPIIGNDGKILIITFSKGYPLNKSWVKVYTPDGKFLWEYEMDGIIMSAFVAENNLIYAITNIHTRKNKRKIDVINGGWEIHAIGEA